MSVTATTRIVHLVEYKIKNVSYALLNYIARTGNSNIAYIILSSDSDVIILAMWETENSPPFDLNLLLKDHNYNYA